MQNSPAPYNAPILYDIPPSDPDATIAVITSPAPLANASKVTAAIDSDNFSASLINLILYKYKPYSSDTRSNIKFNQNVCTLENYVNYKYYKKTKD